MVEADFDPLAFDAVAARAFGRIAASRRRAGRKTAARACDAMIAATALANDLPIYTCNADDFTDYGWARGRRRARPAGVRAAARPLGKLAAEGEPPRRARAASPG